MINDGEARYRSPDWMSLDYDSADCVIQHGGAKFDLLISRDFRDWNMQFGG